MPTAVVFPGQGSQVQGIGSMWVDHACWALVGRAEAALDRPLSPLLLDPDADLSHTREAQLSVLLASLLAWDASGPSLAPAAFAGHSLGQITALIASGTIAFDDGIRLAAARADATQAAADTRPGAMLALLGADEQQAANACAAAPDEAWTANINAPGQIVVGGTPDGIAAVAAAAPGAGIRRSRALAVGGAFHTPLMAPAADSLDPVLRSKRYAAPAAPVVTNHDATAHRDADGWPARLHAHLVQPVRWQASVEAMVAMGIDRFVEVGPGTTLAALIRRIAPAVEVAGIAGPDDLDQIPHPAEART